MDRQTRLVWLGTAVAVAVVWAVGLTAGKRSPSSVTDGTSGGGDAPRATPAPIGAPAPSVPAKAPMPTPAAATTPSATPTASAHGESPGQVLPGVFKTETVDAAWAKDAEATIRGAFAEAHVPEGSLLSVECRRRICRAEIWYEVKDHVTFGKAYAALHDQFGTDVGFERLRGGIRGEPEQVAAYFPRKGYALKDFTNAEP